MSGKVGYDGSDPCGHVSVSPLYSGLAGANQMEHHRKRSFREELVDLLEQAGIEYDEKWLD